MSSYIKDFVESYKVLGEYLNNFLYKDGKPTLKNNTKGKKKIHTYEELWSVLEDIRVDSWEIYDLMAKELGYK